MPYHGGEYFVPNKSLHELIWENLQKHGDGTAIIDASESGKSITYRQLYDFSRKCTAYLQSLDVKKGDFISICVAGSVEFACLTLGILGSGAVVTPCNPSYRKNEILQQFKISRPRFVFVEDEGVETMKAVKAEFPSLEQIFVVGESTEFITLNQILSAAKSETLTKVDIDATNDLAFAPHSSGTTGLPKCAMMTHKNFVASMVIGCYAEKDRSRSSYCDRPMYHTGGYSFILGNLITGAKVVTDRNFQIDKFFNTINNYGISTVVCIPPMLIEMANATISDRHDLSSFNLIDAGGASMSPSVIQRVIKKYKVKFVTDYGMTEIGTISYGLVSTGDTSPSSGKVAKGVEIKITDVATQQECPIGSDGEIRIKSPQVTMGYLGNPEANAITFDRDGWFRTGDIGHLDKCGNIYVVDRLKDIIKYKSLQVSPAELESVIIRHPKVSDVGVIGIPDENSGEVPKAFIVRNDPNLTIEVVHKFVNEHLIEYKHLCGGVEFLTSIPKSETGKIQRNVLKKMAGF